MGWSWSPYCAQCCSWLILAAREVNQKPIFNEEQLQAEQLPTFVGSLKKGLLSVFYDNYIFMTPDESEAIEFKLRHSKTCQKLSVHIKAGSEEHISPDAWVDLRKEDGKGWSYLGVEFGYAMDTGLQWRVAKRTEWFNQLGNEPSPNTNRKMARLLGRLVFYLHISLSPLMSTPDGRCVIKAMSELGHNASKCGWDFHRQFKSEQLEDLKAIWKKAIDGNPFPKSSTEDALKKSDWVMATDASMVGWGYEGYHLDYPDAEDPLQVRQVQTEKGELLRKVAFYHHDSRHIYYREMEAACRGIKAMFDFLQRRKRSRSFSGKEKDTVLVVVDNSAVAWGLRHGFTDNEEGMRMMETVRPYLSRIEVVQVVSRDNPADCNSRNDFSEYDERVHRLEKSLDAHIQGNRAGRATSFDSRGKEILRHRPPDEEMEVPSIESTLLLEVDDPGEEKVDFEEEEED